MQITKFCGSFYITDLNIRCKKMSGKQKPTAYNVAFKLKVINFTESSNNCAAEQDFDISELERLVWEIQFDKNQK